MLDFSPIKNQKGFTLLEALVAFAILAVMMLGTATMLFNSLATSTSSNDRYVAGTIAQGRMEQVMRASYANVSTSAAAVATESRNNVNFTVSGSSARISDTARTVTVTSTWTDKFGTHSVILSGVRAAD